MTDCENAIQGQVRGLGDWVLVPRVPTDAMLRAAQGAWLNDPLRRTTTMWLAMLAAAPSPEVQAEANYAHTVPDECETLHWRGQILSMNELAALAQQPAAVGGAIDRARFERAPCYLCGYNGPGYYQPDTHPCAAKYHAAQQHGGHTDG